MEFMKKHAIMTLQTNKKELNTQTTLSNVGV